MRDPLKIRKGRGAELESATTIFRDTERKVHEFFFVYNWKGGKWEKTTLRNAKNTYLKKLVYFGLICVTHLLEYRVEEVAMGGEAVNSPLKPRPGTDRPHSKGVFFPLPPTLFGRVPSIHTTGSQGGIRFSREKDRIKFRA